jgi:hypothetical protein
MDRREMLAALGVSGASTLLWACGGRNRVARTAPQIRDDVRGWLREAVAKLAAVYPTVHALAVSRRRTTAAIDIIGTGIGRARRDGCVLAVRDRDGRWREHVSELTAQGISGAVRALAGKDPRPARVVFPAAPPRPNAPAIPGDAALEKSVRDIAKDDTEINSRIIYAASMIDVDDATVWSISPRHDREQRLVHVRKRALRAAWAGTRPVVAEAERGWIGGIDDFELGAQVGEATASALLLTTPGTFDEREVDVVLDPTVTASLIDSGARAILTTSAARRPEVQRRLSLGAMLASKLLTLVDDPSVPNAYGGFAFDDEGQPASAITLIDEGKVVGVLGDGGRGRGRRPGHVGPVEPAPSHLRLAAGTDDWQALRGNGFLLEGGQQTVFDATTDRVVIRAARARELKNGVDTGRVFADVELVGAMGSLLVNVRGVAKQSDVVSYRDDVDGEPRWRSIDAPYLSSRGLVRMRRNA